MRSKLLALTFTLGFASVATLHAAATIVIQNNNAAGVGFNDATPATPVGGNPGTTLGQQRLNVFQAAANKWGATITSVPTITIRAQFSALTCTATSAVLGSAGPITAHSNFTGAPVLNNWYHAALANALAGVDLDLTNPEISANFNVNLGNTGCLTGIPFYLGLDNNHGSAVDLYTVLLHELGHGLGFSTLTNGTTGSFLSGLPSIFDNFLSDNTVGLTWAQMTGAQRVASAINTGNLVWTGANVTAQAPNVLSVGNPAMRVISPANIAGTYLAGRASFGPLLTPTGVVAEVMPAVDAGGLTSLACNPLTAASALAVNGKIALVDRGICGFAIKAANVQAAGAVAMIVADNVAGSPPPDLGGSDPSITIPSIRITQADGVTLKNALVTRSRTRSGVFAEVGLEGTQITGADSNGKVRMFAPNPFQAGSSVSHFDVVAFRNLLMEPAINGDLTHEVTVPFDLTYQLLKDIGWQ